MSRMGPSSTKIVGWVYLRSRPTSPPSVLQAPPIIMGTLNTYFCDICGTTKQKSNNWYVVTGSKSSKPRSFRVVIWSEALAGENVAVCGSECLQKTLSQWLTQTQSNQK